jgi:hypothetical protein
MRWGSYEQFQQGVQGAIRPLRRTAVLRSYDRERQTAMVSPTVDATGQVYGPYRVAKPLTLLADLLKPGALVVLEWLTGRTPVVTDLVDRPVDTGPALIDAANLRLIQPSVSIQFAANQPSSGSIAWSAGAISYNGRTYAVSAGSTDLRYVYWREGEPYLIPSGNPTTDTTLWLIATNDQGTPRPYVLAVAGIDPVALVSGPRYITRTIQVGQQITYLGIL